jgi:predicted lipoprotein with Yx(FWY)xxD motif
MRMRMWVPTGLAAVALIVTACGTSASGSSSSGGTSSGSGAASEAPAGSSTGSLTTTKIGSATVLTNAKGFTLYTFAADTPGKSNCNGSCAQFWPPVKGPVSAMSGVSGTFGTITRSDGTMQETWNGHPLYTYVADTAPGQDKGNNLNLSGGVWHVIALTGTTAAAPAPAKSSGSTGGYGY